MQYTYLLLNLFTLLPVLLFSFDKTLRFVSYWKFALPGILAIGAVFVGWDIRFTQMGVWSFNPAYVMPFRIAGLPLEEILFFFTTPFACLFIYEAILVYVNPDRFVRYSQPVALLLAGTLLACATAFPERAYTFINFGVAGLLLTAAVGSMETRLLTRFLMAFVVHLIPFYLVNGVLTSWPVLLYNNAENLGLRVGTIPLEDHAYSLILFLSNLWAYEWFKRKFPLYELSAERNDRF